MKKKYFNFSMKNVATFILMSLALSLSSISCSSDDDPAPIDQEDGKNVKMTVTVSSTLQQSDFISFSFAGVGKDIGEKTLWKINGETQNNQQGIGLGDNDFSGSTKTYVIESIKSLSACSVGVQFINYGEDLKFSIKIEVNGEVTVDESNKTLSGDGKDFTKQYSI